MSDQLAIHGGPPVRPVPLPYGRHRLTDDDRRAILSALESDWLTGGPRVEEFEEALAALTGGAHAVAVSSGTAALHLGMLSLGVHKSATVVTTPLTFVATANAALFCGGSVQFADVDPQTLNIDPDVINFDAAVITPVHFAGQPADMDPILAAAAKTGASVLQDASHALGAKYKGETLGNLGHAAIFSFHPVKHVTTFEGGALVTMDEGLATQARALRNHGIKSSARSRSHGSRWRYEIDELGFNYRLSDVACALGLSQLGRISENLDRRRNLADSYTRRLEGFQGLSIPVVRNDVDHAWHLFPILLDESLDRDYCIEALRAEGIGVNVHYVPVHLFGLYRRLGFQPGMFPEAERAGARIFTLPLFPEMTEADQDDVIQALEKVIGSMRVEHEGAQCLPAS